MPILFLLSSLGAINGVLIGLYLLLKNNNKPGNIYLGGLLLALSLRIGKTVYYAFNQEIDLLILQLGLSACAFIGPFFFLYTKSIKRKASKIAVLDTAVLITMALLVIVFGLIYPYRTRPDVWNKYMVYGIYTIWSGFSLLGLTNVYRILQPTQFKPANWSKPQQHLVIITIGLLSINITYQLALFGWYTYLWGALVFSFGIYYLLGNLLVKAKFTTQQASNQTLPNASKMLLKLNQFMVQDKPYLNQKLKMESLAELAGMNKHTLSKLLNQEYKLGFAHYIKAYRIEEAKQLIQNRPELSLEGIGFEAGFSSKSSFFEAFKTLTGVTPSEFRKSLELVVQ